MFPREYCEVFTSSFFIEHLRWLFSFFWFYFIFSSCKLRLYNLKPWIVVYINIYFMFIHLKFYFCNFFFTSKDFNFDWLFFIKLIWWNRARLIFSKFDQTNMRQILLYVIKFISFNKYDQINLTVNYQLKTLDREGPHIPEITYDSLNRCI